MREGDWPFDCDHTLHNGLHCGFDAEGDSLLWVAPDDGVIHKKAQPTVKSKYRTALGARYATDTFWSGIGSEQGSAELTQAGSISWENDTCHEYKARLNFSMGAAVFSIGNGTTAYIGCHNEVEIDGDSVADSTPYCGLGLDDGALASAFVLLTNTYPPTTWPVYVDDEPGQTLTATLTGMGAMDEWGGGEAEFVKADFGWNLRMLAWPKGSD